MRPNQSDLADENFNTILYTGNTLIQKFNRGRFPEYAPIGSGSKSRTDTDNHVIHDSEFVVFKKIICKYRCGQTDRSSGSVQKRSDDGLSSFDSDGFSIGDWNNINQHD